MKEHGHAVENLTIGGEVKTVSADSAYGSNSKRFVISGDLCLTICKNMLSKA